MTIAAERLALIAVITLPITALSSIYGMNLIVNDRTDFPHLAMVVAVMAAISAVLLRWPSDRAGGEEIAGRCSRLFLLVLGVRRSGCCAVWPSMVRQSRTGLGNST